MGEIAHQIPWVAMNRFMIHSGVGNKQIEPCSKHVEKADSRDRHFRRRVDPGVDPRDVDQRQEAADMGINQYPADCRAENNGAHGEAFNPCVRQHQVLCRQ